MNQPGDTPALYPNLHMRFGSELNAPRPGDSPPCKVEVKTDQAANANTQPGNPSKTPS